MFCLNKFGNKETETGLFIPKGAKYVKGESNNGEYTSEGERKNAFTFKYDSGPYKGVTIIPVHVAGTYGGRKGGQNLGKEYVGKNNKLIGDENEDGTSIQIGIIGGIGGDGKGLGAARRHSHIVVKLNGKRVDPRTIFCPKFKNKK